jgi:hypothetical protein
MLVVLFDGRACRLSRGLEERFGGGVFELLQHAMLIPILPGFHEAAVLEAEDADAGDYQIFARAGMFCRG